MRVTSKIIDCIDYELKPVEKCQDIKIEKMAAEIKKMAAGLNIKIIIPDATKKELDKDYR